MIVPKHLRQKSASGSISDQITGLLLQVTGSFDLKEPYYRQLTGSWWQPQSVEGISNHLPACM